MAQKLLQPLQGAERQAAKRAIERAADLFTSTRWFVAGLCFVPFLVFRGFIFVIGITFMVFGAAMAHFLSGPFEELADDIRNRITRPLLFAVVVLGIVLLGELFLFGFCEEHAYFDIRANSDSLGGYLVVNVLLLALVGGTAWAIVIFSRAWRAIVLLRLDALQGFDVLTGGAAPDVPPAVQTALPFTLPPRPKR